MAITARGARRILDEFLYAPETGITGLKRELVQAVRRPRARSTQVATVVEARPVVHEDLSGYSIGFHERKAIRQRLEWNQHDIRLIEVQYQDDASALLGLIQAEGVGAIHNGNTNLLRQVVLMYPVANGSTMNPDELKQAIEAIMSNDKTTLQAVCHTARNRRRGA